MSLLNRLTFILVAIFFTVIIFAGLQKVMGGWGVLLALIINLGVAYKVLQVSPKGSGKRVIALSIIWTIISFAIILLGGVAFTSYTLNKIL